MGRATAPIVATRCVSPSQALRIESPCRCLAGPRCARRTGGSRWHSRVRHRTCSSRRTDSSSVPHPHALGLCVQVESRLPHFSAVAPLFHTPERNARLGDSPAVDPHRTNTHSGRDGMGLCKIRCPHASRQAGIGVVGPLQRASASEVRCPIRWRSYSANDAITFAMRAPAGIEVSTPRSSTTGFQPRRRARCMRAAKSSTERLRRSSLAHHEHVGFPTVESLEQPVVDGLPYLGADPPCIRQTVAPVTAGFQAAVTLSGVGGAAGSIV